LCYFIRTLIKEYAQRGTSFKNSKRSGPAQ